MESSVNSFRQTLERINPNQEDKTSQIEAFQKCIETSDLSPEKQLEEKDYDLDDQNTDFFSVGNKTKIAIADMDYLT